MNDARSVRQRHPHPKQRCVHPLRITIGSSKGRGVTLLQSISAAKPTVPRDCRFKCCGSNAGPPRIAPQPYSLQPATSPSNQQALYFCLCLFSSNGTETASQLAAWARTNTQVLNDTGVPRKRTRGLPLVGKAHQCKGNPGPANCHF